MRTGKMHVCVLSFTSLFFRTSHSPFSSVVVLTLELPGSNELSHLGRSLEAGCQDSSSMSIYDGNVAFHYF